MKLHAKGCARWVFQQSMKPRSAARAVRHHVFDEPWRQLLRQRRDGKLVLEVKSEGAERFESSAHAKEALFDYIEVFYNQRRCHSTLGQISPAAFERRATQVA